MNSDDEMNGTEDADGELPSFLMGDGTPGTVPGIKLPGGGFIPLSEWIYGGFRSAFLVDPYGDECQWNLFSYVRSQIVAGSKTRNATSAHTNVPRNGQVGLPSEWEMVVLSWRANSSMALEQPVMDFASQCDVKFIYNERTMANSTLDALLLGLEPLSGRPGCPGLPLMMREHMAYRMEVTAQSQQAVDDFRRYLRHRTGSTVDPSVLAELEQLQRLAPPNIASELSRIQAKLRPGITATFWGHLEGYVKRAVV